MRAKALLSGVFRDSHALVLLTLLALITSVPFLHRAYFVDDYYFVKMAQGIVEHPWRPYDFTSDDAGLGNVAWERGQLPRMVNPPLLHYYLAGVITLFGQETWKLRTSYLVFSLMSLFAMYFLGKRFTLKPLAAAALMAVTPAFWLTSYSLLIDGALVAFMLVSLLAWIKGHEQRSVPLVLLSGFLMGLTMLVKYPGVLVVWLALGWQLMDPQRRRWKAGYLAFALFLLVQLLWAQWNIATYGQSHFLASLARGMTSFSPLLWSQKAVVVGSFLGGATVFVLGAYALLWNISKGWLVGLGGIGLALLAALASPQGGFSAAQALLLVVFIMGSLSFVVVAARRLSNGAHPSEAFLFFWMVSGIFLLVIMMPWTAGRYLLCVVPVLCWIFARLVAHDGARILWRASFVATAITALLVAHGDYLQANTIVKLADQMRLKTEGLQALSPKPQHHWYYLADTFDGSHHYLAPLGWENALPDQKYKRGDLLMRAYYRKSSWWDIREALKSFQRISYVEMKSRNPIRTMDVPASAGFYASCWGALPWVITTHPLERYELYQATTQ